MNSPMSLNQIQSFCFGFFQNVLFVFLIKVKDVLSGTKRCHICHMTQQEADCLLNRKVGPNRRVFLFFIFPVHKKAPVFVRRHQNSNICLPSESFSGHMMKNKRL